jgi:hypothetical protein
MRLHPLQARGFALPCVAAMSLSCMTRIAAPDPGQIEIGVRRAANVSPVASSFYTDARPLHERPTVAIVVPQEVADAPAQVIGGSNLYVGRALSVEIHPTQLVVRSMSAYLDEHADVEVLPTVASVPPGTDLVLEPVVRSVRWRTNMWSYAYFASRIEADLDLELRDHTNETVDRLRSGWVAGETYWSTTPTGIANRVVQAAAQATAQALTNGRALSRLPQR